MDKGPGNNSYQEIELMGFSNLGRFRLFLFIPYFILFVFGLVANSALISVIFKHNKLHAPMYILIGALALLAIAVPIGFVPRMLLSFLFDRNSIGRVECLIQTFYIHYCAIYQSAILLGMALDRFVAICNPLRYNDFLSFCSSKVLYHCFCENTAVLLLSCGDLSRNYISGVIAFSVPTSDCVLIMLTYIAIFWTIFLLPAGESKQKAIYTCSTHLMGISVAYFSAVAVFTGYRVSTIPPDIRSNILTLMAYDRFVAICKPLQYHAIMTPQKESQKKALRTCAPHLVTFANFSAASLFCLIYNRLSDNLPKAVNTFMSISIVLAPPLLHSVFYGHKLMCGVQV
ncbi:LOW QUALITY PROTEIN: olfactory receptor 52K2-like [Aplochiton taeniatus]